MMHTFFYRGKNLQGEVIQGYVEAGEKAAVALMIKRMGFFPVLIKREELFRFKPTIKLKELALFFKGLSTMIKAGMTITECIFIMEDQTRNRRLKEVLYQVRAELSNGETITESFKKHNFMPEYAISLMEVGETTGTMESVMASLTALFTNIQQERERLKSSLIYPIILTFVSVMVFGFLAARVIPVFAELFADSDVKLPYVTVLALKLSENIGLLFLWLVFATTSIYLAFIKYRTSSAGEELLAKIQIGLPIVGTMVRKGQISLFCNMLSLCLSSGAPLLKALDITKGTLNNTVLSREVDKMCEGLKKGFSLTDVMSNKLFSDRLCQMVKTGEETGCLEEMLCCASSILNDEFEASKERILRLFEPSIIVVISIFVGFIVISVTMPMFSIYGLY